MVAGSPSKRGQQALTALSVFSAERAWLVLGIGLLLAVVSLASVAGLLGFNSDKESLVAETAPFKARNAAFDAAFPQFLNTVLIVVDGAKSRQVQDASVALTTRLQQETSYFESAFLAEQAPLFQTSGLLFLPVEELEELTDRLASAQPMINTIAADPSIRGLIELLDQAAESLDRGEPAPAEFSGYTQDLLRILNALSDGRDPRVSLSFFGETFDTRRVVSVQPVLDFTAQGAESAAISALRALIEEEMSSYPEVRVRLTGRAALADDEIKAIQDGVGLAGFLSLTLTSLLLAFALRSGRLIAAIMITLLIGLTLSMGWAVLSVGSLNMISAAVVVLFIGLGIDHGLHVALRYREARFDGQAHLGAVRQASKDVGGAVALCAVTSAIGFAAFIPTEYRGLAELGVIAAGSLVIAFVASFTILPALLTLLITKDPPRGAALALGDRLSRFLTQHSQLVSVSVVVLAGFAILFSGTPRFDYSTLAIRDSAAQSVTTLVELQQDGVVTDYAADILTDNPARIAPLTQQLLALETVGRVESIETLVPDQQHLKLEILSDARFLLWPAFNATPEAPPSPDAVRQQLHRLGAKVADLPSGGATADLQAVTGALTQFLITDDLEARIQTLEARTVTPVSEEIRQLRTILSPEPVTAGEFPAALTKRFTSDSGLYRISALPAQALVTSDDLSRFVEDIRSVEPLATGRALTEHDVGRLVTKSFYEAGLIAFCAIALLLLIVLRSVGDATLVLAPLLLAAAFTLATANMLGLTFNFANVIVLPLIFGLGVDSGIHLVIRRRHEQDVDKVMHSSTPQAVLLSALTTICAFSSLSLSRHWGMASMGLLLTVAVFWVLICTVIVLPSLIDWRDRLASRLNKLT